MKPYSSLTEKIIERVLDLSANAQIARKRVAKESPLFDKLTGAVTAYGHILELLTALQPREEFRAIIGQLEGSDAVEMRPN